MSLKQAAEKSPVLFVLGLLFTGFTAGLGAYAGFREWVTQERVSNNPELQELNEKLESAAREVDRLDVELKTSQADRDALQAKLIACRQASPPPPTKKEDARWVSLRLAIPAGFQNGTVSVDGSSARVLVRRPSYIDIQVPDADRPVAVRVESRGRICTQTILPSPTSDSLEICAGEN